MQDKNALFVAVNRWKGEVYLSIPTTRRSNRRGVRIFCFYRISEFQCKEIEEALAGGGMSTTVECPLSARGLVMPTVRQVFSFPFVLPVYSESVRIIRMCVATQKLIETKSESQPI